MLTAPVVSAASDNARMVTAAVFVSVTVRAPVVLPLFVIANDSGPVPLKFTALIAKAVADPLVTPDVLEPIVRVPVPVLLTFNVPRPLSVNADIVVAALDESLIVTVVALLPSVKPIVLAAVIVSVNVKIPEVANAELTLIVAAPEPLTFKFAKAVLAPLNNTVFPVAVVFTVMPTVAAVKAAELDTN